MGGIYFPGMGGQTTMQMTAVANGMPQGVRSAGPSSGGASGGRGTAPAGNRPGRGRGARTMAGARRFAAKAMNTFERYAGRNYGIQSRAWMAHARGLIHERAPGTKVERAYRGLARRFMASGRGLDAVLSFKAAQLASRGERSIVFEDLTTFDRDDGDLKEYLLERGDAFEMDLAGTTHVVVKLPVREDTATETLMVVDAPDMLRIAHPERYMEERDAARPCKHGHCGRFSQREFTVMQVVGLNFAATRFGDDIAVVGVHASDPEAERPWVLTDYVEGPSYLDVFWLSVQENWDMDWTVRRMLLERFTAFEEEATRRLDGSYDAVVQQSGIDTVMGWLPPATRDGLNPEELRHMFAHTTIGFQNGIALYNLRPPQGWTVISWWR